MSHKVLVTGSGQCGTTFLMELFTELGLDTGYEKNSTDNGMEWLIWGEHARDADGPPGNNIETMPYIIKNPDLCRYLLDRKKVWGWEIDHVFILLRGWAAVANHRFDKGERSSMVKEYKQHQLVYLSIQAASYIGVLMLQIEEEELPHTFMRFPRIVKDPKYLFKKLKPVLGKVTYEAFLKGFNKVADIDKVHYGDTK